MCVYQFRHLGKGANSSVCVSECQRKSTLIRAPRALPITPSSRADPKDARVPEVPL